ncbi:hypothetical protein LTR66_007692, partial [Elasticomyces elasticus]
MASARRFADQLSHQENETTEQRRTYGSHWGAEPDQQGHQTAIGATAATLGDQFGGGGNQDPALSQNHSVDPRETQRPVQYTEHGGVAGVGSGPQVRAASQDLEVMCGPLLNYRRMSEEHTNSPIWHGSVLVVTTPGQQEPELQLRCLGPTNTVSYNERRGESALDGYGRSSEASASTFCGILLYEDPRKAFWRIEIELPFQEHEASWVYHIPRLRYMTGSGEHRDRENTFVVPAKTQSMRIMFHSCNGFSAGTDVDAWSGPALWNDVIRMQKEKPMHVMIGGGDQIYNDGVRVDGPLKPWTEIGNPQKRRAYPFNEEMRAQCDEYYFQNYVKWYNAEPFASANGQIPQLNIWDDHDIIDGFGSYTDHFMRCPVFRGIGGVAHKYYSLFQHHIPPPKSTFTTDAPATMNVSPDGSTPVDAVQLKDTFVMTPKSDDPSYIIGLKPGPYVAERSRSIYCQLGARIAFVGIDARTERTRHQINYPETYDKIFHHVSSQIRASNGAIKHLILLLGVPIAYPRLQWLENILHSPIIGPIRFLNKRFGLAGGFFNHFDGSVDLLDDLDDHYTARQHKKERRDLVQRLQNLAREHSVRVSILGGDVHLAAL